MADTPIQWHDRVLVASASARSWPATDRDCLLVLGCRLRAKSTASPASRRRVERTPTRRASRGDSGDRPQPPPPLTHPLSLLGAAPTPFDVVRIVGSSRQNRLQNSHAAAMPESQKYLFCVIVRLGERWAHMGSFSTLPLPQRVAARWGRSVPPWLPAARRNCADGPQKYIKPSDWCAHQRRACDLLVGESGLLDDQYGEGCAYYVGGSF